MADDTGDSVKDRFARHFEGEEDEVSEQGQRSKAEKNEQSSKKDRTANIKQAWDNHSFYLPEQMSSDLSRSYKRLDLDLDEEYGLSIKKTRHYYPLIVKLGLERLEELGGKEVKEELEGLESR